MRRQSKALVVSLALLVVMWGVGAPVCSAPLPFPQVSLTCSGDYTVLGINIWGRIDGGPEIAVATASDPYLAEQPCRPGHPVIWTLENLTTGIPGHITILWAELTYACHLPPVTPLTWNVSTDSGGPPWSFPCSPSGITVTSHYPNGQRHLVVAPTLTEWGMIALGVLLAAGLLRTARKRAVSPPVEV